MYMGIEKKVKDKILGQGRGWCFGVIQFLDLGNDNSVRKALSALCKKGVIRRLTQGIYDYPETHEILGLIPPDISKAAQAIADKNGVQIQATGSHAANLLGLSTQVPGRVVFLTEGPSKRVKIGNQEIIFKRATLKVMAATGTKEGLLIQALKSFGKGNISKETEKRIAKLLRSSSEESLRENMRFAPAWARSLIFRLANISNKVSKPSFPALDTADIVRSVKNHQSNPASPKNAPRQKMRA